MWYRNKIAYREVSDPKGERTYHRTRSTYDRPIFFMSESEELGARGGSGGGFDNLTEGPGLYTTQNPAFLHQYKTLGFENVRDIRLPKGTRILDGHRLTPEEVQLIISAWNKKYNTTFEYYPAIRSITDLAYLFGFYSARNNKPDGEFWTSPGPEPPERKMFPPLYNIILKDRTDNVADFIAKLYPLLIDLGFDAIEYTDKTAMAGNEQDLEPNLTDVEYIMRHGKPRPIPSPENDPSKNRHPQMTEKLLASEEYQNYGKRKRRKIKKNLGNREILIINRAILTKPELFQKARFRPETLTDEERKELEDEQETTGLEQKLFLEQKGIKQNFNIDELVEVLQNQIFDPRSALGKLDYILETSCPRGGGGDHTFELKKVKCKIELFEKLKDLIGNYKINLFDRLFTDKEIVQFSELLVPLIGMHNTRIRKVIDNSKLKQNRIKNFVLEYFSPNEEQIFCPNCKEIKIFKKCWCDDSDYDSSGLLWTPKKEYNFSEFVNLINKAPRDVMDNFYLLRQLFYPMFINALDKTNNLNDIITIILCLNMDNDFPEYSTKEYEQKKSELMGTNFYNFASSYQYDWDQSLRNKLKNKLKELSPNSQLQYEISEYDNERLTAASVFNFKKFKSAFLL